MPCKSGNEDYKLARITTLEINNDKLEAIGCALISEIERMGFDILEFITRADLHARLGGDIQKFWQEHSQKDRQRLERNLSKYSEHEIRILKEIIEERIKKDK